MSEHSLLIHRKCIIYTEFCRTLNPFIARFIEVFLKNCIFCLTCDSFSHQINLTSSSSCFSCASLTFALLSFRFQLKKLTSCNSFIFLPFSFWASFCPLGTLQFLVHHSLLSLPNAYQNASSKKCLRNYCSSIPETLHSCLHMIIFCMIRFQCPVF